MDDKIKLNEEWIKILNQKEKSPKRVAKFGEFKNTHLQQARSEVNPDTLRNKKKPNRFVIDNEYVKNHYMAKFPPLCTLVLSALLVHCNTERQDAFPSILTIKEHAGCTNIRSVISALRILEAYGIINIRRSKRGIKSVNVYFFRSPRLWRPLSKDMKKIKLTDPLPQWQNLVHSTGRKESYRTGATANLTNLRDNYNNKIQNIGDILRTRFKMPEDPSKVAIPTLSSNTVVDDKKPEDMGPNTPVRTGEKQEYRTGTNAITIDTRNNGKLTGTESQRHGMSSAVYKREITVEKPTEPPFIKREKGTEDPFINGEKWTKEDEGIGLMNISNEDIGPGSATL